MATNIHGHTPVHDNCLRLNVADEELLSDLLRDDRTPCFTTSQLREVGIAGLNLSNLKRSFQLIPSSRSTHTFCCSLTNTFVAGNGFCETFETSMSHGAHSWIIQIRQSPDSESGHPCLYFSPPLSTISDRTCPWFWLAALVQLQLHTCQEGADGKSRSPMKQIPTNCDGHGFVQKIVCPIDSHVLSVTVSIVVTISVLLQMCES
eukprot:jgi/Botrbrau1/23419/Bobra.0051s0062.1